MPMQIANTQARLGLGSGSARGSAFEEEPRLGLGSGLTLKARARLGLDISGLNPSLVKIMIPIISHFPERFENDTFESVHNILLQSVKIKSA